jgi:outer membrane protein assembly factor BamE (lipoprotein component of BamABCDE complex)
MKRHTFVLALCLMVLSLTAAGYSADAESQGVSGKAMDQMALKLEPGDSVEDVRSELGKPQLEKELGKERVLSYGPWQLVFTNSGLKSRTRYYRSEYHRNVNARALARKVSELQLGMSVRDVKEKLGMPEALELYRNEPHKEVSLW